ncbi:HAD hydrolase-like protein [Companilactobacillus paralimentarius]|jgi:Predicted phosphatases|uniref:HAD hydrolase-like protein n=1 Tax=Companilactobacillus paralimentarius TaxID=83526 RepID=UPI0028534F26|nr:HAD hydrolase-like protein [Companilactobacillus paralimentarius]MDR4933160.1 HAD hydrolase-like protein [Companilactobacillus paralimentarius]
MKYIFFDFDGTIADTKVGTIKALQYMAQKLNITDLGADTYQKFIGPAITESFGKYYPKLPKERYSEAIAAYDEYYKNEGLYQLTLYPQIEDVLSALKDDGYRLYISSAKTESLIKKLIAYLKLNQYFTGLYGASEDEVTRSSKADILKYALENANANADESVIIGDRSTDIQGGIANNVHTLGITYGFGDYAELRDAGAESILEDPTEIPSEIRAM